MITVPNVSGELAALSAAGLWAIASVVYGILGQRIPPLQLNLIKGVIAIALLIITIIINGNVLPTIAPLPLLFLLLSGAMGIGLGDTAFLAAINQLGARRVLLLGTLAPPLSAIAATIFLQESLNTISWCGILLTILGVAWVVTERVSNDGEGASRHLWIGIGIGLLAATANAIGAVFSRAAFTEANISPLWGALLRLIAGVLIILIWALFPNQRNNVFGYPYWKSRRVILASFLAAFLGTYLGIWLQQTAIKLTDVGIASTLMQTSPIFVIPIAMMMGEKVSWRAILGVVIAIFGISLLFYYR